MLIGKKVRLQLNKEQIQDDDDPENPVYIHGDDYDELEGKLEEMLKKWLIIKDS